jgi:hypothetical protein
MVWTVLCEYSVSSKAIFMSHEKSTQYFARYNKTLQYGCRSVSGAKWSLCGRTYHWWKETDICSICIRYQVLMQASRAAGIHASAQACHSLADSLLKSSLRRVGSVLPFPTLVSTSLASRHLRCYHDSQDDTVERRPGPGRLSHRAQALCHLELT